MSTLSRVIFSPDLTPPSTPGSPTATALSQTTIRITWSASTDTGGSGLAGYRVLRSTTSGGAYTQVGTDLSTASLSYDDASLGASTTRFYRIVAFDGAGNISSQSTIVSATTQAAPASATVFGVITNYASHNLQTNPISTFDLQFQDYRIHQLGFDPPNAGTATYFASGWPIGGGPFVRLTPPTGASQDIGMEITNLSRNNALDVQEYQYRYMRRFGPTTPGLWGGAKGDLTEGFPTNDDPNGSSGSNRPIIFVESYLPRANTLVFGVANGTLQMWGSGAYQTTFPPLVKNYVQTTNHLFYVVRPTDPLVGGTFQGSPVVSSAEVLTFEHKIKTTAHGTYTNGFNGLRVYRQDGSVLVTCLRPWRVTNDLNETSGVIGARILRVQQFGCGQHNVAQTTDAGLYMDIGRYVTDAVNLNTLRPDLVDSTGEAWLGPVLS